MKKKPGYGEYACLTDALRDYSEGPSEFWGKICDDAANELDRKDAQIALLRKWADDAHQKDCNLFPDSSGNVGHGCSCGRDEVLAATKP